MTAASQIRSLWFRLLGALLAAFAAWLCFGLSGSTQSVHSALVFRANLEADVHLPTFLPPAEQTRLRFGPGAFVEDATALFAAETPILRSYAEGGDIISFHQPRPASAPCTQVPDLCVPGTRGVNVIVVEGPNGSFATSSYAALDRSFAPIHRLRELRVDPAAPQQLYAIAWPPQRTGATLASLRRSDADTVTVDLSTASAPDPWLVPYLLAAAVIAGLLAWFAPAVFRFWLASLRASPLSATAITAWTLVCYVAVFPGVFTHDTQFGPVNAAYFDNWYSTLYFLHTGVFRIVGYEWIQLVSVLAGYFAFLIVLQTMTVALTKTPTAAILKCIFAGSVVLNPAIFSLLFVQQRYFLAAALALLGAAFALFQFVKELRDGQNALGGYALALAILSCAALMRTEYFTFIIFLLACLALRSILTRSTKTLGAVLTAAAAVAGAYLLVERVVPQTYEHNTALWAGRYASVTSVAIARPYVTCDGASSSRYEELIERSGGMAPYCSMRPESFWFSIVRSRLDTLDDDVLPSLNQEARRLVLENPEPYLADRAGYAQRMLRSPYWHLISRYQRRDETLRGVAAPTFHEYHADRFALLYDWPSVEPLNRRIVAFYHWLSTVPPSFTIIACLLALGAAAFGAIYLGSYVTSLFTALVLTLFIPIVALAPVDNWAYLVFGPTWAAFVLPLCLSESASRRARRGGAHPEPRTPRPSGILAKGLGFTILSGAGWLLDMAIFSMLVSLFSVPSGIANFISASIGAISVFALARRYIFGKAEADAATIAGYVIYTWVMIVVWSYAIALLSNVLVGSVLRDAALAAIMAKILVTPLSLTANFAMSAVLSRPSRAAPSRSAELSLGKVLIFVPSYRCEAQIPRVLEKLERSATTLATEILVVDNRSPDETAEAAVRFAKAHPNLPVRVVRNKENYGLGGSHKAAFAHAIRHDFNYVVTLHGDDQGDFSDLAPLLRAKRHRDFDALLGARFMPGSKLEGYSLLRTIGNVVFNALFSISAGRLVADLGSGLNLYDVSQLKSGYYKRFADDLTFNYYMVLAQRRQRLLFFPLKWSEQDQISNVKLFSQTQLLLRILVGFTFGRDRFLAREHRQTPRDAYEFEELWSAPQPSAVGLT